MMRYNLTNQNVEFKSGKRDATRNKTKINVLR